MNEHRRIEFSRKTLAFLVLVLCFANFFLSSPPVRCEKQSDDINTPMNWIQGYTLILLKESDIRSVNEAKDFITNEGGSIAVISDSPAMLGWVPPAAVDRIVGRHGVESVHYEPVDAGTLKNKDEITQTFVGFFNSAVSGELERQGRFPQKAGDPLINDALEHPFANPRNVIANLADKHINWDEELKRTADNGGIFPGYSDYMTGTIAFALFLVESDGSWDADAYSWTSAAMNEVKNHCLQGATWWANKAKYYNRTATFYLHFYGADKPIMRQGYEPILHPSSDDYLWIGAIMAKMGYSSGNWHDRVTAYNAFLKNYAGTNWAYSCFVAYNPSPAAPSTFTDGYFAYAYLGGPYVQMLYRNDGWPVSDTWKTFAHETGHIFWACDEYYQAGYGGCTSCEPCNTFRPITNGNCAHPNCNPNGSVDCMMKNDADALCTYTIQQVGWAVPMQTLTIQPSAWGTTTPAAGAHSYLLNTDVPVTAFPARTATFVNWTGDASGTANPVIVKMGRDKTIKANIRKIFPPANLTGSRVLNRSFSQAEYIDTLSWEVNANNAGLNIASYNIYLMNGSPATLLATVGSDQKTYTHRMAGSGSLVYNVVAVSGAGNEGAPAEVTVH